METAIIVRRMTILFLMFTIFALAFGSLVQTAPRPTNRVRIGTNAPCYHQATQGCTVMKS